MTLATLAAPWFETALNAFLRLDPDTAQRLDSIAGRLVALEIVGPDMVLLVRVLKGQVQISGHRAFEPDTVIRGSPIALARLGRSADAPGVISGQGVEIRGDAEVGRVFREVLAGVEIDWEEMLAKRIGDIPAHQIGNTVRAVTAGVGDAAGKLRMDLTEYLQEEARITPTRIEVEQFMDEVDALRTDIDRLETRVERLVPATTKESQSKA